jgi:hypothetical protein
MLDSIARRSFKMVISNEGISSDGFGGEVQSTPGLLSLIGFNF